MMNTHRSDCALLHDILIAIDDIEMDVGGLEFDTFTEVRQIQHAVLYNLQIIGEASNRLTPDLRNRYALVPWSKVIGLRNMIAHGYFVINLEMIWKTITENIPVFKEQITAILKAECNT